MLTLLAACISLKPTEVRAEESLLEAWERQNQAATGENHNNVPQLKEEDILRMNQGNADFLYNDEGYVTVNLLPTQLKHLPSRIYQM